MVNNKIIFDNLPSVTLSNGSTGKLYSKSLADKITLTDCALFLPNYDDYVQLFGEDILADAAKDFPLFYICKSQEVPSAMACGYLARYPLRYEKSHSSPITEYQGEWQRSIMKPCYTFLMPEFQGPFEYHILKKLSSSAISIYENA